MDLIVLVSKSLQQSLKALYMKILGNFKASLPLFFADLDICQLQQSKECSESFGDNFFVLGDKGLGEEEEAVGDFLGKLNREGQVTDSTH